MARAAVIVIRGRKRKPGNRHACGKLVQEKPIDPKVIALRMPHRQGVPAKFCHDPKAESEIGRLQLCDKITPVEYDAAIWYRGVVNRYRILIEAPMADPKSLPGEGNVRGMPVQIPDDEAKTRKEVYDDAFDAVMKAGQRGARAVARVAVYDEKVPEGCYQVFRLGLLELAIHRGMCTNREALDIREQIMHKHFRNK